MYKMRCLVARFIIASIFCGVLYMVPCYAKDDTLKIVATQTMYADVVKEIGKDKVDVKYVAQPKFNVHFIQPKPSDVRNVAKADLYVNAGLDLEAWSDPLLEAAGKADLFRGAKRTLTCLEA